MYVQLVINIELNYYYKRIKNLKESKKCKDTYQTNDKHYE